MYLRRLSDAASNAVIAHYEVKRILFYARGPVGSADQACFAFTWSHGDSQDSVVFQCHIFKCLIPEAVAQVSACFSKAFELIPAPMTSSVISPPDTTPMMSSITSDITGNPISSAQYEFIVALEIREKMSKVCLIRFLDLQINCVLFSYRTRTLRFHVIETASDFAAILTRKLRSRLNKVRPAN